MAVVNYKKFRSYTPDDFRQAAVLLRRAAEMFEMDESRPHGLCSAVQEVYRRVGSRKAACRVLEELFYQDSGGLLYYWGSTHWAGADQPSRIIGGYLAAEVCEDIAAYLEANP